MSIIFEISIFQFVPSNLNRKRGSRAKNRKIEISKIIDTSGPKYRIFQNVSPLPVFFIPRAPGAIFITPGAPGAPKIKILGSANQAGCQLPGEVPVEEPQSY